MRLKDRFGEEARNLLSDSNEIAKLIRQGRFGKFIRCYQRAVGNQSTVEIPSHDRLGEIRKVMDAYSSVKPSSRGRLLPKWLQQELMQLLTRPRLRIIK